MQTIIDLKKLKHNLNSGRWTLAFIQSLLSEWTFMPKYWLLLQNDTKSFINDLFTNSMLKNIILWKEKEYLKIFRAKLAHVTVLIKQENGVINVTWLWLWTEIKFHQHKILMSVK